jgi:hypothetical protein
MDGIYLKYYKEYFVVWDFGSEDAVTHYNTNFLPSHFSGDMLRFGQICQCDVFFICNILLM